MGASRPRDLPGSYTGNIADNESIYIEPVVGEGRVELFSVFKALIATSVSSGAVSSKADISDLLAGTYSTGGLGYVTDASTDSNIPSGWALYKYDGGGTTSIANYTIIISEYWLTATYQSYDNSTSGLTASTTKTAIDELKDLISATATGLKWKEPCELATTANLTLSGEQTIDDILTSTSRILVKNQTDESENGIYVTGAGAWTRATDMDADSEVSGFVVNVLTGTANADTTWQQTGAFTTIDTDDIVIIQFSGAVPNWTDSVAGKVEKSTQAEAEANTDNDRGMTPLTTFQQWVSNIASYTVSALNTTSKFIVGAINELKALVDTNTTNIGTNTTNIGTNTTNIATNASNISGKAAKAGSPTSGNYHTDDGSGNPQDSGDSKASEGNAEVITGHSNTKILSVLRGFQLWVYSVTNYEHSGLTTTDKTILGAINEIDAGGGGSGIASIVEDTTPQLGGDLDLNGNTIGTDAITDTEIGYLNDVTSNIQTQLNAKFDKSTDDEDDILNKKEFIVIACSDEISSMTATTAKAKFAMPFAATITGVIATVNTAPTGANLIVDINEGASSILSTKLTIDATETSSTTASIPVVISDPTIAQNAIISIDIDQIGATIAGAGLKVTLICTR